MVYYAMTNAQADNFGLRKFGCKHAEDWNGDAHFMMGKKKGDLVVEGAMLGENLGVDEMHIYNIITETKYKVRQGRCIVTKTHEKPLIIIRQYWYIYKENGKWFFKMDESCKAKHEITI